MPKAILVTEDNTGVLSKQYNQDLQDVKEVVGLYLVADFGGETILGALTKTNLDAVFITTGVKLNNDYFEIVRK